jgi:hypothetical protein
MNEMTTTAKAGLNGNFHRVSDRTGALTELGVTYHGDGDWTLPAGAEIDAIGGDDWTLTLADGSEWRVWSEE